MLQTSPDGYIRLQFADFILLPFVHLFSQEDPEFLQELLGHAVPAGLAGFTEWKSDTEPAVSLGWGWFRHRAGGGLLAAPEKVRGNLMLIDAQGYDLGPAKTADLLALWLNIFAWRDTVEDAATQANDARLSTLTVT